MTRAAAATHNFPHVRQVAVLGLTKLHNGLTYATWRGKPIESFTKLCTYSSHSRTIYSRWILSTISNSLGYKSHQLNCCPAHHHPAYFFSVVLSTTSPLLGKNSHQLDYRAQHYPACQEHQTDVWGSVLPVSQ